MNKQELLPKLIEYYETAIKEMPEGDYEKYMSKLDIENGVCFCAKFVFNTVIYFEDWVKKHGVEWAQRPCSSKSRTEAISLLQIRVDIMKKELTLKE